VGTKHFHSSCLYKTQTALEMMFHTAESLISMKSVHFCCAGGHYVSLSIRVPVVIATADKIHTSSIWKPQKLQERAYISFMLITVLAVSYSAAATSYCVNPLTPELNPSAQRCLTRFFSGDFAS
jgi:hypothetical protein